MRRYVPLLFSTATTWCPETRQDVRIHVSEGRQLWGNPSHSLRATETTISVRWVAER